MKAILSVVIAGIVLLSGCQFKTKWRDTTGQSRPDDLAQADARDCYDVSGYAALNRYSTSAVCSSSSSLRISLTRAGSG